MKARGYVFLLLMFTVSVLSGCNESTSSTLAPGPGNPPIAQAEATFDDATFDNAVWD